MCCFKGMPAHSSRLQDAFLDANVVAYNALITACVQGEEWQLALQVFSEALKSQLQLNVVTYSSALKLRFLWFQ